MMRRVSQDRSCRERTCREQACSERICSERGSSSRGGPTAAPSVHAAPVSLGIADGRFAVPGARIARLLSGVLVALALASCPSAPEVSAPATAATWPTDCVSPSVNPPLGIEAARVAHRMAARRQSLRFREAVEPGWFLRRLHERLDEPGLAAGQVCLSELADLGSLLFEHEYGYADGLGHYTEDAEGAGSNGPFRRVHAGLFGGPETNSCASCHWVGGPNGAGAETDNALLFGDGDRTNSGDARNPPALIGLGIVEALAHEMSEELQALRTELLRTSAHDHAAGEVRLRAKGVDFGVLRVAADGEVDTSHLEGVDADLVVKPFGWKGTLATFAAFSDEALQVHIGIQNAALLSRATAAMTGQGQDADDPDGDGHRRELGAGPSAALNVHLALLEPPIVEPLVQHRELGPAAEGLLAPTTTSFAEDFQRGRGRFHELGCANCHQPMLVLNDPVIVLEGLPPIDLSASVPGRALSYDAAADGYPVWLFSDLKRHDMGRANASRHVQSGVDKRSYLTPRLWGVADSAPYLHDGRAPSFDYAIAGHEGEGANAREAFAALSREDKGALRVYLMSLRRAPRVTVP